MHRAHEGVDMLTSDLAVGDENVVRRRGGAHDTGSKRSQYPRVYAHGEAAGVDEAADDILLIEAAKGLEHGRGVGGRGTRGPYEDWRDRGGVVLLVVRHSSACGLKLVASIVYGFCTKS
eukprot:1384820-Amorphochlora_amoeboformis.AAC.1